MKDIVNNLNSSALQFLETLDLNELYEVIVYEGLKITKAKYGSIYLEQNDELERVFSTVPEPLQVQIRKKGFTYKAFRKKETYYVRVKKIEAVHREIKDYTIKSVVFIPLVYHKTCVGVLSLDSKQETFTEKDIRIWKLFGAMVTLAIRQGLFYRDMKQALELRDLFISLSAHEFRTPLTTISGYVQLLKNKKGKDAKTTEWVNELETETNRLITLASELLQINRIKSGTLSFNFKETHMAEVVHQGITRFTFGHPENLIDFQNHVGTKDLIIADTDKMLQVITNLLENAAKYTNPSVPIEVSISKKRKSLIITITDHGQGIEKEDIEKIFYGFYKGKNSDEKPGIGLGLYISKNIIDAHNGELDVSSEVGVGTTFEIILPLI